MAAPTFFVVTHAPNDYALLRTTDGDTTFVTLRSTLDAINPGFWDLIIGSIIPLGDMLLALAGEWPAPNLHAQRIIAAALGTTPTEPEPALLLTEDEAIAQGLGDANLAAVSTPWAKVARTLRAVSHRLPGCAPIGISAGGALASAVLTALEIEQPA